MSALTEVIEWEHGRITAWQQILNAINIDGICIEGLKTAIPSLINASKVTIEILTISENNDG